MLSAHLAANIRTSHASQHLSEMLKTRTALVRDVPLALFRPRMFHGCLNFSHLSVTTSDLSSEFGLISP